MLKFTILENEQTSSTRYFALRIEIGYGGGAFAVADCVVCENYEFNSDSTTCEIVSVEPGEMEEAIKSMEDQIIDTM